MRTDFHIHFHVLEKKKKSGLPPIYLRLTVDRIRKEYSISRRIHPEFWNVKLQKVMGNNPNEKEFNNQGQKVWKVLSMDSL